MDGRGRVLGVQGHTTEQARSCVMIHAAESEIAGGNTHRHAPNHSSLIDNVVAGLPPMDQPGAVSFSGGYNISSLVNIHGKSSS